MSRVERDLNGEPTRQPSVDDVLKEGSEARTARRDVTRRQGDSDAVHARLKKAIEKREKAYLWTPADMITFKPALLSVIYGDGRALFGLSTINQRPRYYVIRGSSDWGCGCDRENAAGPDFGEMTDDILTALEDQFGRGRCGYSGNSLFYPKRERIQNCKCEDCTYPWTARWPVLDGEGGCHWDRMDWPRGFLTVENPLSYMGNLLAAEPELPRPRVQGPGALGQVRLPLTKERQGMLAKVHMARKQLGLDEAAYRDVVERITGNRSAGAASDAALHRLLGEFARLGFKPSRPQPGRGRADDAQVRMIHALWTDLQPFLTNASPEALRAFVQRQTRSKRNPDGVSAPEFLDAGPANKVIEGLKAWLAREQAKQPRELAPVGAKPQ